MRVAMLMLRRYRWLIGVWVIALPTLTGVTVSPYQSTYPTPGQRRAAVELAQHDTATTLMYGSLPDPGTAALMFTWEIGAIVTILTAIMAVLLAISLTRAGEDDGTTELLRSCGIGARGPLDSAFIVLSGVASALASGCALVVGVASGRVDSVTWPGAAALGVVVGLTFLLVAMLTLVLAQVAPTTADARSWGFAAVGAAFALRAVADTQHLEPLNWISPLALRATVRPFAGDHWWALALDGGIVLALGLAVRTLSQRREYGSGLQRRRARHESRLNVRSPLGLCARLSRTSVLTWTIAVASIGALFCAMGSGVVRQSQQGDVGGFLGSQLGSGDPVAGYLAYWGTLIAMVVCVFAVLSVLMAYRDERAGLSDLVLTTGAPRWAPLAAQVAVTTLASAVILLTTAVLSAIVAPTVMAGPHVAARAFVYVAGQWPGVMAIAGWTALLTGFVPRRLWLAWIPLVASAVLAVLGSLLGISRGIRDLGLFQHVPDVAASGPDVSGVLVLLASAGVASALALAGVRRRESDAR